MMRSNAVRALSLLVLAIPAGLFAQDAKLKRTEVIVIADLSDRIEPKYHPGQIERDTAILGAIADEFGAIVKRNRYLFSHDRLRTIYIGGQNSPFEPRVDVAKMNADHRVVVKELPRELAQFKTSAAGPYARARTQYIGADLWSWFKNTSRTALRVDDADRDVETRIVILTDGYLEFAPSIKRATGTAMRMDALRGRSDWQKLYPQYKLAPVGFQLPHTKVLILELAPVKPTVNITEQEILERYWKDWFGAMGVETAFLTNAEAMPTVRDAIRQFLLP